MLSINAISCVHKPDWVLDLRRMRVFPFLMMAPLCFNTSLSFNAIELPSASYASLALFLFSFAIMAALYFREGKMPRYGLFYFIFFVILLLSSFMNEDSDIKLGFYTACQVLFFFMLVDYYKDNIRYVLYGAAFFFSLCVYLNLAHFLMHSELWILEAKQSTGYLLGGNYNGMGVRMLLALVFSAVSIHYSRWWIVNLIIVTICSLIPVVVIDSMTSLIGIVGFLLFLIIPTIKIKRIIVAIALVFFVCFQIFIVFSGKGLENNDFAVFIIEDLLSKDITFTNRTFLWDLSLNVFWDSPIWGYGFVDMDWYTLHVCIPQGAGPHNMILSVMINGGIILLGLYVYICAISLYKISNRKDRVSVIVGMSTIVMMILLLTEMQSYVFIFFLTILSYYSPFLNDNEDNTYKG